MSLDAGTRGAPTPLRAVVGEVARFERQAFAPLAGLRVAVGVSAALAIGLAAGSPAAAASLAAGALLVGFPTVVGGRRIGIPGLALIAASMAVSTFVGSATGEIGWLHTAVLVPWCLAGGLLLALPNPFTSAGTQGIAAMIVFGRFAEPPLGALRLAAYVLAGGAIAIGVLGLTRSPLNSRVQRRALAGAATSLAALARAGPGRRNGVASAEALVEAEVLLQRGLGRTGADELRAVLDVLRRARLELLAIDGLQRRLLRLGGAGAAVAAEPAAAVRRAVEAALATVGDTLEAIARTVVTGMPTTATAALDEAVGATRARLHDLGPTGAIASVATALEDHLVALAAQLRAAADLASGTRRAAVATLRAPSWHERLRDGLDALRSQATLRAPVGRHAVRLAVVVTAAEVIAQRTPLGRGYWVALTASVVLRPEFGNTFRRGLARLAGTSGGVLLAGLLAVAVHPDGPSGVVAIGLLCLAAGATFQVSYALFSGLLTGAVVLLVGVVDPGTLSTALDRLADTAIGGALALAAYALWPTWSRTTAAAALAALTRAQRDYLGAVLAVLAERHPRDPAELRRLARAARAERGDAQSAVERAVTEPAGHGIDIARAQGALAALGRIGLTTHALRSDVEADRLPPRYPEIGPFADAAGSALGMIAVAIDATRAPGASGRLAALGAGLRGASPDRPAAVLPPLRRLHEELEKGLGDGHVASATCPPVPEAASASHPPAPDAASGSHPPAPQAASGSHPPAPDAASGSHPPAPEAASGSHPPAPDAASGSHPPAPDAVSGSRPPAPDAVSGSRPPVPEAASGSGAGPLDGGRGAAEQGLLASLDELVDAIDTLAAIVGVPTPAGAG